MVAKVQVRPVQSKNHHLKKQLLLLLIVLVACFWVLFQINNVAGDNLLLSGLPNPTVDNKQMPGFLVNTKGCRIQDLDPFDPSLKSHLESTAPVLCDKENIGQIVKATDTKIYIDSDNTTSTNESKILPQCCYTPFWRITLPPANKYKYSVDVQYKFANECVPFHKPTVINDEFIKVKCKLGDRTYTDYFSFAQKNQKTTALPADQSKINVLIVGMDAISRLNLHRQMPMTVSFFKKIGAIEMLGYNKVADNTFPNLIPVLTGMSEQELKHTCWAPGSVFDKCHFVWEKYKEINYTTGFGEDSSDIGLFNYLKKGFREQPTDFYLRVFNHVAEDDIGHTKLLNTNVCLGKILNVEKLLGSIKNFAITLKDYLSFGFFWGTSISHDYLGLPKYGDPVHFNFFNELKQKGVFENSIIIAMSDHGIRWGRFRQTYHGYLEERLPFLFFMYPQWFSDKYSHAVRNMRINSRRLTTPFDLHETLLDLTNLNLLTNDMLKIRIAERKKSRGHSMFMPMEEERTCNDAGISENWCTCHQSSPVALDHPDVLKSAVSVISYLNNLLLGYKQCSELNVRKIINARSEKVVISLSEKKVRKFALTDYAVTIETQPGNALFEATVRYSGFYKNYTVIAPVSRINIYGNQSSCIANYQLKLYCYCKNLWGT